jgi:2-oxo-4-hydroxy-4-carboxy-5-ureidoimidazoline decarboxylase
VTLDEINGLDREAFTVRLGGLAENSPWVAYGAWESRPFANALELVAGFRAAIARSDHDRKLELLRAHPDLAGRAAVAGELTPESTREQTSAGLMTMSPEEYAVFRARNDAYRERFGFPFVICARENDRASILAAYSERLGHEPDEELAVALDEVVKIIRLRVADLIEP